MDNKLLKNAGVALKKNAPTILSVISAVGVVGTAIFASQAGTKAEKLLRDPKTIQAEPPEHPKWETIKLCWRCYIPAAVVGATTIFCIFEANSLNHKQTAAITSAYLMLRETYQKYRQAAKVVYGEDADAAIQAEVAKETYVSSDGMRIYSPDEDTSNAVLFYDSFSQRYFTTTLAAVINAQYHINRNLQLRGDVSLNEFYEFLGIEPIEGGYDCGWDCGVMWDDGYNWLDFKNSLTTMDDGLECYIITSTFEPVLFSTIDQT